MNLKQCKVLLVDDIKANINILTKALGGDYTLDSVITGESVLPYVRNHPTDLILLDIMMPDMDGYEVLKQLKADECAQNIPVIFITSRTKTEDESKGLELGAVDYITKPFSIPIIRARVRNHLIMKKQRDMLEDLSNFDGLTGIPNRRSFDRVVDTELRRSTRSASQLSLLLIDVDHFKEFNDNYGHAAGDDCLKRIATALADSVRRPSDFVARYGGEEFAAVLPKTDLKGAATVAKFMLQKIKSLHISHDFSSTAGHVTVSIGISAIVPEQNTIPDALIQTADLALYKAKNKGRNRIEQYIG